MRAWEVIWHRHSAAVRSVVRACVGSDSAVDDLVQEAFVALHRAIHRLEQPHALRPYLLGAAARLAALELRTRTRRLRWLRLTASGELPETSAPPAFADSETVHALTRVLGQLGPDLRVAFVLRYVEDFSPGEVARALGISESSAKRLATRARDRVLLLAEREPTLAAFNLARPKEQRR
jgi:RNA polymerase sigma-70 factor (ECF subfamily)